MSPPAVDVEPAADEVVVDVVEDTEVVVEVVVVEVVVVEDVLLVVVDVD